MSSISDAIPKKSLHKARNSSAFLSMIFVKDFVCGGRVVDYFWPPAILKKDFLQRFLAEGYQKIIPFNIRLNSDDPCPPCAPWIKKRVLRGLFRVASVDKFPVIRAIFVEESRNFANQNPFSAMMHHKQHQNKE